MEHIHDHWTVDDVENVMKASGDGMIPTKLLELVDEIAGTPAGDWTECPLCLDNPTNPVMTTCRHVFCSECINGVFEMPAARGQIAEEEEEEDVEALGDTIACPVCRHKLGRKSIGAFTPPKESGASATAVQMDPEQARDQFKKLSWEEIPDDSDENSDDDLPDLATAFSKLKGKEKKIAVPASTSRPEMVEQLIPVTIDLDTTELRDDEDFLDFFNRHAVPKVEASKPEVGKPNYWDTVLDSETLLPSSKLTALRYQLSEWRLDAMEDKIIIFSQFVKALDLVGKICQEEGWGCTRYHGALTLEEREAALREFEDDEDIPIMLTCIKCGGVGLNLTGTFRLLLLDLTEVANRVVNLDVWWNWQVENQAIDRYDSFQIEDDLL